MRKAPLKKSVLTRQDKQRLLFIALGAIAVVLVAAYIVVHTSWEEHSPQTLSVEDTIASENLEPTPVEGTETIQEAIPFYAAAPREAVATDANSIDAEEVGIDQQAFDNLKADIEGIKSGNPDIISKYFGVSDVFTPETVADRVSATTITLVSSEQVDEQTYNLIVHVCTIDYPKMNSDYAAAEVSKQSDEAVGQSEVETEAKKEVTKNLIDGNYSVCYNIPLVLSSDGIVISEAFKQAITGSWYSGTNVTLTPVECIVNTSSN